MAKRRKVKLKLKVQNPLRLLASAIIFIVLIILIVMGIRAVFGYDPVKKMIEDVVEQDVIILEDQTKIVTSTESGSVNAEDEITYQVIYVYKAGNSNPTEFIIEDGLDIEISDQDLAVVSENRVVIGNVPDPEGETELKVTVKYGKLSADYTYTVNYPTE